VRRTGTHPPCADAELAASDGRGRGDRPTRGRAAGLRVREADGRRRSRRRHDADRGGRDRATCRCGPARDDDRDLPDGDHDSAGRARGARFDGARADRDDSCPDVHDAVEDHDDSGEDDDGAVDHDRSRENDHDTVEDHDHADDADADRAVARLGGEALRSAGADAGERHHRGI
jgi:hypothetical protein